jgi:CubicO group peptidase (beta-lactamase class C family)
MLLQFGLEQGLGLDLQAELQRRLFAPLGLKRTSLIWRADFATNLADGWDETGKVEAHDERSRVRGAGSMDTTLADMAALVAAMVRGYGVSERWHGEFARGTLPITTRQQFPSLQPDAPPAERPNAKAALGVIAFDGPQGPGWFKGGHNDTTANTVVCLALSQRCVVILANDVRAERAFPALVRAALGETGAPFRWEYPGLPAY